MSTDNISQLIVIGNGFDLNCHLKSKYEIFLTSEFKDIVPNIWTKIFLSARQHKIQVGNDWNNVEKIIEDILDKYHPYIMYSFTDMLMSQSAFPIRYKSHLIN